ncbi:hypothetical protein FBULB1_11138 [Fusarium bulbicola]|nr:hypothetical protein FBULB1_11138 [Fusarium bulbicola]
MPNRFKFDSHTDSCAGSSFKKKTDNRSPFADGTDALIEWTYKNKGGWRIGASNAYYSSDILIGGSNTGANTTFSVRKEPSRVVILRTKDVGDAVGGAYHRFKKTFKCVVRMAGKGQMKCWNGGGDYKNMLHWEIDRSDRDIETETESQEQLSPELTSKEKQHQGPQFQGPRHRPIYLPFPVTPIAPVTVTVPVAPRPVYPSGLSTTSTNSYFHYATPSWKPHSANGTD